MKLNFDNIDFEDLIKSIPEGEYAKNSGMVATSPYVPLMTNNIDSAFLSAFSFRKIKHTLSGPPNILTYLYAYFGHDVDFDQLCKIMEILIYMGFVVNKSNKIIVRHKI
jgi:hypothetical protein